MRSSLTRRSFMFGAVGSALAAMALDRNSLAVALGALPSLAVGERKSFAAGLRGQVLAPGDAEYERARRVFSWNPITAARMPALIVRCAATSDVQYALRFAREHRMQVAVRGGGHDVLGESICDGGMVIDLSPMRDIKFDATGSTARVGAGARSAEVNMATRRWGMAAALGANPMVGIAGLTLGGGLGWLMGRAGAACDNLLSAEIVTADGRVLAANATENPDLFWGLRGGGGNFGIVTGFEYVLHHVDEIYGGFAVYPPSKAREFLRFYRDFMAAAPDELVIETSFDPRGILVMACYSGAPSSGARVLAPFTSFLGAPLTGGFEQMPYLGGAAPPLGHGANQPMHAPPSPAATRQGLQIYWKGGCVAELSDDALDTLLDQMRVAPPGWSVGLGHYMHGAVCRVSAGETPLIRRAGSCSYFINQGWTDPGAADARARMSWVDSAWRAMQRFSGGAAYVNYLSDDREAAVRSAYGANYPRLAALKNRYDPDNIFRLNRNIRPSKQ